MLTMVCRHAHHGLQPFSTIAFPIRQLADTGLSLLLCRRLRLPTAYCRKGAQLLLWHTLSGSPRFCRELTGMVLHGSGSLVV